MSRPALVATLSSGSITQLAFGFEKGWAATLPSRATLRFSEGKWILHLDNEAARKIGKWNNGGHYNWCKFSASFIRPRYPFKSHPINFQHLPGSNLLLLDPLPWTHVEGGAERPATAPAPSPSFCAETLREAISLVNLSLLDLPGASLYLKPDGTLGARITVDL